MYLAFLNLGYTEIIIILVVAVLVFGGRLPEVAKGAGKWFFDIKRGINTLNRDIYSSTPNYSDPNHTPGGYPADIGAPPIKNISVDVDTPSAEGEDPADGEQRADEERRVDWEGSADGDRLAEAEGPADGDPPADDED